MNKKRHRMTVLLVSAALLIVLLTVLIAVRKKAEAYMAAESDSGSEVLFDISANDIAKISYTPDGGSEVAFTRNDTDSVDSAGAAVTEWTSDSSPDFTVDQDKVDTLAASITGITVTQVISDVTDLGQYGLDKPLYTGAYTLKDGTSVTFTIGSTNETASVTYVLKDGDTSTVYAVSTGLTSEMTKTLNDYAPDSTASSTAES